MLMLIGYEEGIKVLCLLFLIENVWYVNYIDRLVFFL